MELERVFQDEAIMIKVSCIMIRSTGKNVITIAGVIVTFEKIPSSVEPKPNLATLVKSN